MKVQQQLLLLLFGDIASDEMSASGAVDRRRSSLVIAAMSTIVVVVVVDIVLPLTHTGSQSLEQTLHNPRMLLASLTSASSGSQTGCPSKRPFYLFGGRH